MYNICLSEGAFRKKDSDLNNDALSWEMKEESL